MKVQFCAADGTVFDNVADCVAYESEHTKKNVPFIAWDGVGNKLDNIDAMEAMFCVVKDADAAQEIESSLPHANGLWIWFYDDWNRVEEIEKIFSKMKDATNEKN